MKLCFCHRGLKTGDKAEEIGAVWLKSLAANICTLEKGSGTVSSFKGTSRLKKNLLFPFFPQCYIEQKSQFQI